MIKIISGPQDTKGFDQHQLYCVYETQGDNGILVALATSLPEAKDAVEMLTDLVGGTYHVSPPQPLAN